ncbi:MAG: hypothetical protein V2I33_18195 [Kangiellaceae bacterium]|jgi:magnesium-transporting ATPase (P-type)|nr:hypothetical protein [Kangiellaceae bacterium]
MSADIRVWVLTGDKQQTAIEIGKSCSLIKPEMELIVLSSHSRMEFEAKVEKQCEKFGIDDHDFDELETVKEGLGQ